jgi:hypothetical protein
VPDACERAHQSSNVRGDGTLLNIAEVVDSAHAVEVSEVVVRGEDMQWVGRLMHVHRIEGELGRKVSEMEAESWV